MDVTLSDQNSLSVLLWKLAKFVRDKVVEAKNSDNIVKISQVYLKSQVTQFSYNDQGSVTYVASHQYLEKPEWHWKHQHSFTTDTIKTSSHFSDCTKAISAEAGVHDGQAEFWLSQFTQSLVSRSFENLDDENVVDLISVFLADLQSAPMSMAVSVWADGLWLKDDYLYLDHAKIRRPVAADFETELQMEIAVPPQLAMWPQMPTAILELQVRGTAPLEAQREVTNLMSTLRLFRLGSVRTIKYSIKPKSIFRFGGTHTSGHLGSAYKFPLAAEDRELLQTFVTRIKPLLPDEFSSTQPEVSPADLAFRRFSDAVLRGGNIEEQITSAITCLEALFLKSRERTELSHKLSLRVASLLRLLGLRPLEVQEQVHQAYEIRSTYIHGSVIEKDKLHNADNLCRKVLDYARMCVVVFLQMKQTSDKDEFINKLDRALLEAKSMERIKTQLSKLVIPGASLEQAT
jgi:hypothetical protein